MEDELLELVRRGEDSVVEFKAMSIPGRRVAEPDAKDVADEIAAAANTIGATFICFDEQVVASADMGELKHELFSRFRTALSSADDIEFLRKLHLAAPDDSGVLRPTVAGLLFAAEHPEEHLPSAYIQAVCYRGTERNADHQLDARDITGPLDVQIAEACRFVKRNMRIAAIKDPARIDIPQFAMSAVFEAIVNAVAHRDYSISGAKIRLHMFVDRLEIFSPGGLPNSLTLDEIGERQFARNELICTCLARCPLSVGLPDVARSRIMDRRGEGVPVIFEQTERLSGTRPVYRLLDDSELLLTIGSIPLDDAAALHKVVSKLVAGGANGVVRGANGDAGGANGVVRGANDGEGGANGVVRGANDGEGGAIPSLIEIISAHPGQRVPFLAKVTGRTEKAIEHEIKALKEVNPPKIEFRGASKTGGYYIMENKQ